MKYLDTNVIVYAIENHPKYGAKCKKILQDVESGKLRVSCSMLVLVELMSVLERLNRVLSKQGKRELVIGDNVEALLSIGIAWIDLDFLIIEMAASYSFENQRGGLHPCGLDGDQRDIGDPVRRRRFRQGSRSQAHRPTGLW